MRTFFGVLILASALSAGVVGSAVAASTVFLDQTPVCGTVANNHLCRSLTAADHNKSVTINAKAFSDPLRGPVMITWSGSVNCRITAKTISANHFEAEVLVHLQLTTSAVDVEIGGPGAASTGFLTTQPVNFIHRESTPVTLTRLYKGIIQNMVVRARPIFKAGTGSCAVTGGSFTTTVVR
jgi:hypothetical protein